MIQKLTIKDRISVYDFIINTKDVYEDMYITENKSRHFLRNLSLINKILKHQEVYGLFEKELQGILLIYRSKGFRPYIKLLAKSNKYYYDLMMFLKFNFNDKELFAKLKINNPLVEILKRKGFINIGMRGKEVLLHKVEIKEIYKLTPKDEYLIDNENRLY